jgi:hypothetical protein
MPAREDPTAAILDASRVDLEAGVSALAASRRRRRRPRIGYIAPGSLADRIRAACPRGKGATLRTIIAAGLARPEDVRAEVTRLRDLGAIRTWGRKRAMRYFWRGPVR